MFQAEDRAHRIGQAHSSVNIYYIQGRGTVDEMIMERLAKKSEIVRDILDHMIIKEKEDNRPKPTDYSTLNQLSEEPT